MLSTVSAAAAGASGLKATSNKLNMAASPAGKPARGRPPKKLAVSPKFAGVAKPTGTTPASVASGISKTVLAQIYARLRATMMQLWLPSLCPACKPLFIRSAARSTDKALPVKDFCKDCRAFLASKQQHQQKTSCVATPVKKEPVVTATTVLKNKVISEIESLIKAPIVEVTPGKSSVAPPRYFLARPEEPVQKPPQPRLPLSPAQPIYTAFSAAGIDWCRYCGTTAGASWRPGPWGPRSLCFRHGREYAFHKRLDLSAFEAVAEDRAFPVLQGYCKLCWRDDGIVRRCHGCANGFHAQCYLKRTGKNVACLLAKPWYCNATCPKHFESGGIRVAHSTKEALPYQLGHVAGEYACGEHPMEQHADVDEEDNDDSFSDAGSEHLDVVSEFKPSFFIRLKEPVRPPTPHPIVAEAAAAAEAAPKKRRVSCPTPAMAKPVMKQKRSRASSASIPDFLITIDHSIAVRRDERPKTPVLCPAYKVIQRPPAPPAKSNSGEPVSEEVYSQRHCRYEELEKTTRLLKPDILSTLFQRGDEGKAVAVA